MTLNQTTKPVEIDVCDFLNRNLGIKDVVGQILEEYIRASDIHQFPVDVIHAAAIVSEEAGELVKAANDTYYHDCPAHRQNLMEEAVQTGAMAIRFLENIGNLKARE
jgi:hypothetical protein